MYRCFDLRRILSVLIIFAVVFSIAVLCGVSANGSTDDVFLPVIMYHSVYDTVPQDYIVTPKQFEADMEWLSKNGYTSATAEQVIAHAKGKYDLPEKSVMITFDDGHYNNLSQALPILEKYDMKAVVSIVGRYTDDYAKADPHCDAYSYLTWDDVSELVASGRIEIGSHTYDMHSNDDCRKGCSKAKGESDEEYCRVLREDLALMQAETYANIGKAPVVFAYPFGCISREGMPVIRKLGFEMTLTCREGANYITRDTECLYGIFRYNRSGLYSTEEFMRKIFT